MSPYQFRTDLQKRGGSFPHIAATEDSSFNVLRFFFICFLLKGSRELMDFYNLMPLCVNGSPKFMKKYALSRASAAIVSWLLETGNLFDRKSSLHNNRTAISTKNVYATTSTSFVAFKQSHRCCRCLRGGGGGKQENTPILHNSALESLL